ncbi:hypothetical protein E2C01_017548 [Portunus trituberculatus]|uniref:Uncharacterized protein n=1 Tax=Portunus trituberculatus TaxID=210409 RepID=A0A5B7DTS9_PORTR|nr:hypothetical protein [Portunus trituberculatus]
MVMVPCWRAPGKQLLPPALLISTASLLLHCFTFLSTSLSTLSLPFSSSHYSHFFSSIYGSLSTYSLSHSLLDPFPFLPFHLHLPLPSYALAHPFLSTTHSSSSSSTPLILRSHTDPRRRTTWPRGRREAGTQTTLISGRD